jgi:cytochrome c-type biogenesis protein
LGTPLASVEELDSKQRFKLLLNAALFSVGFIIVFTLLGLSATAMGAYLITNKVYFSLFGGLVVILFGLKFFGWLQISALEREARFSSQRWKTRFSSVNALLMGVVFALGWTPCIGPVLGSVLTFTASQTTDMAQGALYLFTYGLGFAVPLMVFAALASSATGIIRALSRQLPRLEKIAGVLLVGVGIFLMLDAVNVPTPQKTAPLAYSTSPSSAVINPPLGTPSQKPRMVEFYKEDCSVCRQMMPTMNAFKRQCGAKGIEILQIDLSKPANAHFAADYKIRGVPTFVFMDTDGHEAARLIGYQPPHSLEQALAALVGDDRCDGLAMVTPQIPTPSAAEYSCNETEQSAAVCN